jgi:hypothetical protein
VGDLPVLSGVQSIKYDAFFAWCWDIDMPVEEVWRRHKKDGYPDEMLEFYLLAQELSDKTQYIGQCIVNNNHASFLGSVEHYRSKFGNSNVYGNVDCKERSGILDLTRENLELIIEEKVEAVRIAAWMQEILRSCADRLPADDYKTLQRAMDYQEACVRVWRYHTEAFFRYRLFDLGVPGGEYEQLMKAVEACELEIRKLRSYDEVQADNAYALIGSIRSLSWVKCCSTQRTAKGVITGF